MQGVTGGTLTEERERKKRLRERGKLWQSREKQADATLPAYQHWSAVVLDVRDLGMKECDIITEKNKRLRRGWL